MMPPEITPTSPHDAAGPAAASASGRGATTAGLLHSVLDSLIVGVLVLDADGRIVLANRVVCEMIGVEEHSIVGQRLGAAVMGGFEIEDGHVAEATAGSAAQIDEWWRDESLHGPRFVEFTRLRFRYVVPGTRTRRGWVTTRTGFDDDGQPVVVVSISDVTAQEDEREQLRHLASTDVLTGLDNRAVLDEGLERYVAAANESGVPSGSVLFIDLDGFKQVNDELGHGTGDRVLEIVGRRLRDAFRDTDVASRVRRPVEPADGAGTDAVAARYGGDEFVVLTDAVDPEEVEALISRVRSTITGSVVVGDVSIDVDASIGSSLIEPGSSVRSVLEAADREVYEEKLLNHPAQ